jgi:S-formylglutathione hydrolase FrmB
VDDELYDMSLKFRELAREYSVDLTYEEGAGAHTWDFGDVYIRRALGWLDRNLIQRKQS